MRQSLAPPSGDVGGKRRGLLCWAVALLVVALAGPLPAQTAGRLGFEPRPVHVPEPLYLASVEQGVAASPWDEPGPRMASSCCPPGSASACGRDCWSVQVLPEGLIYHSYLAGAKEARFASVWFYDEGLGWLWDATLGGRVGLLRFGTPGPHDPEGWQIDLEGAAMPRLDVDEDVDLVSSDFRFGFPLTYGRGPWRAKFAYYHLSSHLGDEFQLAHPEVDRINFSRDVLVAAAAYECGPDVLVYGEAGWALRTDGGTEPWEFQFGAEYSPAGPSGLCGTPFAAVNGHLREEVDFGGNVTAQVGWQWRGRGAGRRFRVGVQYYNGKSPQFEFFDTHEEQFALGLWQDF